MATESTPAEAAVARGMALLDAKVPGWEERVDTDILDASDRFCCPIALATQSSYHTGLDRIGLRTNGKTFGFYAQPGQYRELTSAWRSAILARRAARTEAPDAP